LAVIDPETLARTRLRERQGAGARYDAPTAPAADLLLARRGTAYFARQLNALSDIELDGPSALAKQTRRHVVVSVAFQARWLARLVAAARLDLDVETIVEPVEPELLLEHIELEASLPAHALRSLFRHSEVHLNVEWRDLPDEGWTRTVRSLDGRPVRIDATPMIRARKIWRSAMDLDGPWRHGDIPVEIKEAAGDRKGPHSAERWSRSSPTNGEARKP
jgi:maleylpyruvate isomerase